MLDRLLILDGKGLLVAILVGALLTAVLNFIQDEKRQILVGFALIIFLGMVLVKLQ